MFLEILKVIHVIGGIGKSLTSSNNIMLLRGQRGERVGRIDGKHTAFVLEFFKKGTVCRCWANLKTSVR